MRHVIICLLCGIAVMTMAASVLAQKAEPCDKATCPKPDPPQESKECTRVDHCPYPHLYYQGKCMKRTQCHTIKTNALNLIIPGAILTAGFVALAAFGIYMLVDDAKKEKEDCERYGDCAQDPYTGIAIAIFVPPLVLTLVPGVILLSVGLVKRKKIKSGKLGFNINTKHGKLTLEPTFAVGENGGVFGLSGRF